MLIISYCQKAGDFELYDYKRKAAISLSTYCRFNLLFLNSALSIINRGCKLHQYTHPLPSPKLPSCYPLATPLTIPLLSSTLKVAFLPLFCIMIRFLSAYYYRPRFLSRTRVSCYSRFSLPFSFERWGFFGRVVPFL